MSDVVGDFCAITGSDEETAIKYLSMNDFNLEEAVGIFMAAHEDADKKRQPAKPSYGGADAGSSNSRVSQLSGGDDAGDVHEMMFQQHQQMQDLMSRVMGGGAGRGAPDLGIFGGGNSSRGGRNPRGGRGSRAPRVEELPDDYVGDASRPAFDPIADRFRPPAFAFSGTFEQCCRDALAQGKWVILNILRRGDFVSGCINRDIWSDSLVSDMVPHMCMLFQVLHDGDVGQVLVNTYRLSPKQVPCILILNPLTQAIALEMRMSRLAQSNGQINVTTFLDELTTFVEKNYHVLQSTAMTAAMTQSTSFGELRSSSNDAPPTVDVDDDEQDEDEQLQRALAESAAASEVVSEPARKQAKREPSPPASAAVPAPSPPSVTPVDISTFLSPDGSSGASVFKLKARLPQGQVDLVVSGSIPVALLVRYIAYQVHLANTAVYPQPPAIELRSGFPPKPLTLPQDERTTLVSWGALRPSDMFLVHVV